MTAEYVFKRAAKKETSFHLISILPLNFLRFSDISII